MGSPPLDSIRRDLEKVENLIRQAMRIEDSKIGGELQRLLKGGKRLRPALVILASKFHPSDSRKVISLATAVELLHAATLIHDDAIDQTAERRGQRTLNSQDGNRTAVLSGDYLFAWAAALAARVSDQRLIRRFAETAQEIVLGELIEVTSKPWVMSREEYYQRISRKTAALFAMATEAGALLSGAPEKEIKVLKNYGHDLGMAFQIMDDVLDVVGDAQELGKPAGSDLRQGLVTLPVLYYIEDHPDWRDLPHILGDGDGREKKMKTLLTLVKDSPAISASHAKAQVYTKRARKVLRILPDNRHRQTLLDLADWLLLRRN